MASKVSVNSEGLIVPLVLTTYTWKLRDSIPWLHREVAS